MANKSKNTDDNSTFDFDKCLREDKPEGGADADDPAAYCNKMKYYVDNNLGYPGWARSEDEILTEEDKRALFKALIR